MFSRLFGHPTHATLKNIAQAGRAAPQLVWGGVLIACHMSQDSVEPRKDYLVGTCFNGFHLLEFPFDYTGAGYQLNGERCNRFSYGLERQGRCRTCADVQLGCLNWMVLFMHTGVRVA